MQNLLFIFLFVFSFSSYSEETIVDASSQGDLKQVNHLISSGADVNAKDKDGETALMLAVRGNHSKIVGALIGAGSDLTARNKYNKTALEIAIEERFLKIAEILAKVEAKSKDGNPRNDLNKALLLASEAGHSKIVEALIDAGANVNVRYDTSKETSLMLAVRGNHSKIVGALIDAGADLTARNKYNKTALEIAIEERFLKIAEILAKVEAKSKDGNPRNDLNKALLLASEAGHSKIVEALIDAGANVNVRYDTSKETSLMLAVRGNHSKIVGALIDAGADLTARNKYNKTALEYAIDGYRLKIAEILAKVEAKSKDGNPRNDLNKALLLASEAGHSKIVGALIDAGANVNVRYDTSKETSLMLAVRGRHSKIVEALIDAGADLTARNKDGETALEYAIDGYRFKIAEILAKAEAKSKDGNPRNDLNKALLLASEAGHSKIVDTLIDAGADANAKDKDGETALMLAVRGNHSKIVGALIDAGADVNAKDKDGETSLMLAVRGRHSKIVGALIDAGADLTARNKDNKTALEIAIDGYRFKIAEILAKVEAKSKDGNPRNDLNKALLLASEAGHSKAVDALIDAGANVNVRYDTSKETSLMLAVRGRHSKIVEALIDAGADLTARNKDGETALEYAINGYRFKIAEILAKAEAKSKDGNPRNDLNKALLLASEAGHSKIVEALIDAGSDLNARNEYDKTPLMLASRAGHSKIVDTLRRAEARSGSRCSLAFSGNGSHF